MITVNSVYGKNKLKVLLAKYEENKRSKDSLLAGFLLQEAEQWLDNPKATISKKQRNFIVKSQKS